MWYIRGGGDEKCITGFWSLNLKERDHLKDKDVNGRIILKLMSKKQDGRI
jgi:hypothetical protein